MTSQNYLPSCRLTTVAIPTRNRPAALNRCLATLILCLRSMDRAFRILVIDTSIGGTDAGHNEAIVAALSETSSVVHLEYVGQRQIEHLVTALINEKKVDPEIISFLFQGMPGVSINTGAARNIHLIKSVGEYTLTLDDDIVPQLYDIRDCCGSHLTPLIPGFKTRFYPTRRSLSRNLIPCHMDIISAHERLLGKTVSPANAPPSLGEVMKTQGDIVGTVTGVVGSITNDSPLISYYSGILSGDLPLPKSKGQFKRAIESGEVSKVPSDYYMDRSITPSSYSLGLDNTKELPPWLPLMRSQDTVFGIVLKALSDRYRVGAIPFAVLHDRPEKRKLTLNKSKYRLSRVAGGELVGAIINRLSSSIKVRDGAPRQNGGLRDLGESLLSFAGRNQRDFQAAAQEVAVEYLRYRCQLIERFESMIEDRSSCIQSEVRDVRNRMTRSLRDIHYAPQDLGHQRHESVLLLQRTIELYGRALINWNVIIESCRNRDS